VKDFWGIVVDQSLRSTDYIDELEVIAKRELGSWGMLLVCVSEDDLEGQIQALQQNMIDAKEDCWYAHFFCDKDLIVVYQDRTYHITTDPTTWAAAVQHGLDHGVLSEQLDFEPRTKAGAAAYFQLEGYLFGI